MKKRIGWLNNKPIIQGDKNLKNFNELHIDELTSNSSDEGDSSGGIQIEYYKLNNEDEEGLITSLILVSPTIVNIVVGESYTLMANQYICSNGGILLTNDKYVILGFAFINVTSIGKTLDGPTFTFEGTLQERADYLATINDEDKINIYDYIEPITEEEFYNLKYE